MTGSGARRVSLISLACSASACSVDDEPPVIIDAQFEDRRTIVVRFSEPLGSIAELIPEDHFRLASAFYIEDLGLTVYYDLAHHFPEDVPGVDEPLGDEFRRHGFTRVTGLAPGERDDELRLLMSYPLEPYVCEILPQAEALGIPAGIHLHYATGSAPRITDEAGNELADHAGWWVKSSFATTREGEFPAMDVRMPIPCPPL